MVGQSVFVVDCFTIRYIYCSVTLLKIHQKCSQDKISCPSISTKSCPQMGYSRKNPEIFRFIHLLLLEILGKISFQPWKFWKIVWNPLEIPQSKTKTHGNAKRFPCNIPGNSTFNLGAIALSPPPPPPPPLFCY